MTLLDFNVALGRLARSGLGCFDTVDALTGALDSLGISGALVYHALAAEADVTRGNALLLEQIANAPHLHACWVMAPPYLDDLPKPDRWVCDARDANVRAVRIFPRYHLYSTDELTLDPLAAALAEARMPLLFDFGARHWSEQAVPWPALKRLAQAHPSLKLVVIGATVGDVRDISAILNAAPNIYIECHALVMPDMYEQFADAGHASRLLFGSGLPRRAAECSVHQLRCSAINKADIDAMGGGNARRLLELPDIAPAKSPPASPPSLNIPIIDVHGHCGSWERTTTPVKGPDAFVRSMDRCGIDKLVFSSFSAIHGETRLGNAETAEWVRQHPTRLYGYCVINPNYPEEVDDELRLRFDDCVNFAGLKLHCQLHGAQLHDAGYARALTYASEHGLPVLVHGGGQDKWDDVCAHYPGANFIMAHACAWDGIDATLRELYTRVATTPNVYVDIAGSPAHRGALRALIDLVGADKILYGSDFPMFDFAFETGRVIGADLSPNEKRAVCSTNAQRIFKFS